MMPPSTQNRHSRESGNPGPQGPSGCPWTPACARATTGSLRSHLACHRQAAAGTARRPAADNAGKHAGIAAGADDHNPARTEFVDGFAGEGSGPASGDALGASDEVAAGDLAQPIELFIEPRLRPAGILEGAMMLGADHQERVAGGGVLDVAQHLPGFGEAPRQALGVARLLVDD